MKTKKEPKQEPTLRDFMERLNAIESKLDKMQKTAKAWNTDYLKRDEKNGLANLGWIAIGFAFAIAINSGNDPWVTRGAMVLFLVIAIILLRMSRIK